MTKMSKEDIGKKTIANVSFMGQTRVNADVFFTQKEGFGDLIIKIRNRVHQKAEEQKKKKENMAKLENA